MNETKIIPARSLESHGRAKAYGRDFTAGQRIAPSQERHHERDVSLRGEDLFL